MATGTGSEPIAAAPSPSAGWSRLSIWLHWLIVALIIVQIIERDFMVAFWDATLKSEPISSATLVLGWTHIIVGSTILVAAGLRLIDRLARGRPAYPPNDPIWAMRLARVTHALIYAVLILMPVLGLAAWLTGSDTLAGYHTTLWAPLLILCGVHICGALAQHFVFKSDVLKRMMGRSVARS